MTTDTSPSALWHQAGGGTDSYDHDKFMALMREHGHIVPKEPGDDGSLPCGWPQRGRDSE